MSAVSSFPKPLPSTRSRVTNGKALLTGEVDGRTAVAKRYRDILSEITSDLGGPDTLSEGQRQLARLAAAMSVEAEQMAARSISGDMALDTDAFGKLADRIGRVFARLGLRRVAREPLTLAQQLAAVRR